MKYIVNVNIDHEMRHNINIDKFEIKKTPTMLISCSIDLWFFFENELVETQDQILRDLILFKKL